MASREQITRTVHAYLSHLAAGDADAIAALYSTSATLEDPVGAGVREGQNAIREFYEGINGVSGDAELLTLRVVGHEVAFHFSFATSLGETEFRIAPIDFMTFDQDGKISSMRAFWSQDD